MTAALDLIGLGALISATGAALVSIIVALRQPNMAKQVDEVHAAVSTSTDATLGELAVKNEERHDNGECTLTEHTEPK